MKVAGLTVTAGVVLAAGLFAGPVPAPSPRTAEVAVQLTAGWLADQLDQQRVLNSELIEHFFGVNSRLVADQTARLPELQEVLAGADGNAHLAKTALEQFFDANNAVLGAHQAALLGVLGARGTVDSAGAFTALDPAELNESLIVDARHVQLIPYAGAQSAIGHYFGAAFFYAMINSGLSGKEIEAGVTGQNFNALVTSLQNFNTALAQAEHDFSTQLTDSEIALQKALFGTDTAFNGALNHAFNAWNMSWDAQQQGLNGLLGITDYDPQQYTAALLIDPAGQSFSDGSVGGLTGMFAQLGLLFSAFGPDAGSPPGFSPDPAAVQAAFGELLATVSGGPFGDTFAAGGPFSVLLADLQTLFADPLNV